MTKPRLFLARAVALLALAAASVAANAQIAAPRTLAELKTEIQQRADRKAYPVSELNAAEVREALANLRSLDRDEWAAAWSAIGDRRIARGRAAEPSDRTGAAEHYKYAFEYYLFARFPLENSTGKVRAYGRATVPGRWMSFSPTARRCRSRLPAGWKSPRRRCWSSTA